MGGNKQTKIVATIGPASESKSTLRAMVEAGMNVARLNFSHGAYAWHRETINRIRGLSEELGRPIAILADLQGPRIRTAVEGEIPVHRGDRVQVSEAPHKSALHKRVVYLDLPGAVSQMRPGEDIMIEDGTIELTVTEKNGEALTAEAQNDGVIKNRKGVILPDTALTLDILSEKDRADLAFVLEEGVDYVGLSFVGTAADIEAVRAEMRRIMGEEARLPGIVAKIERKAALEDLPNIVKATDAVMVARGDLGIEMPESEVALLQKRIIRESLAAAKPVIVATQMLKSMTENPRPTRAEVSDVSNAVIDHADAVMLSEESAMGKYPVEAVVMMAEIIEKTEESPYDDLYQALDLNFRSDYALMIRSLYELAKSFRAKAILILSRSGFTARLLSHFRPEGHLLVATNDRRTYNQLALVWGADPYLFEGNTDLDSHGVLLMEAAKRDGKIAPGDAVAVFNGRTPAADTLQLVGIKEVR